MFFTLIFVPVIGTERGQGNRTEARYQASDFAMVPELKLDLRPTSNSPSIKLYSGLLITPIQPVFGGHERNIIH